MIDQLFGIESINYSLLAIMILSISSIYLYSLTLVIFLKLENIEGWLVYWKYKYLF